MSRALLKRIVAKDRLTKASASSALTPRAFCSGCFEKQREIDKLKAEVDRLREGNRGRSRTAGSFGSDTHKPSSREDNKKNTGESNRTKRGGAKNGHSGKTRDPADRQGADSIVRVDVPDCCPDCQSPVTIKGTDERRVLDVVNRQVQDIVYEVVRGYCNCCKQSVKASVSALPRSLLGNQLLSEMAVQHYFDGISLGKVASMFGGKVNVGTILSNLHRLGHIFLPAMQELVVDYRQSKIKHADETGWRTDGQSGYAWIFCSLDTIIFEFTNTRAARVPERMFGNQVLPGFLVVDRYAAYSGVPCLLQYCFAHLLREVEALLPEFSESNEVHAFVDALAPLLADAMRLGRQALSDEDYYSAAVRLKNQIMAVCQAAAEHLAIRHIQDIFVERQERLFHWVADRDVPSHNNFGERTIRRAVIARKVSFGSQSEAGARTRSTVMSVLHTAHSRLGSRAAMVDWLKTSLDHIAHAKSVPVTTLLPKPTSRGRSPPSTGGLSKL